MTPFAARIIGLVATGAFVVLQAEAWDSSDVDVFGLTVPVWLLTFVFYALGVIGGWAAERSRPTDS